MAEENTVIINQLLTGQDELKADVSDLKEGQKRLETDISGLQKGQKRLETDVTELKTDVAVLKTDVAELKTDVTVLKTDVAELKEGQRRAELFLLNMENRIVPIINATYEEMKLLRERMAPIEETQIEHSDKLENHELRILKLEHTK